MADTPPFSNAEIDERCDPREPQPHGRRPAVVPDEHTITIDTLDTSPDNQTMDTEATNNQPLPPLLVEHRAALLALAEELGFHEVRLFGSMARGDDREDSDVDLLVTAKQGTTIFHLGSMIGKAEALIGRRVDVVTLGSLPEVLHEKVLTDAVPL